MIEFPKGRRTFVVRELGEPEENALRVVVTEASRGEREKDPLLGVERFPVAIAVSTPSLELLWDSYIAYAVRDESYALDDEESAVETMLHVRKASTFLDYVAETTTAGSGHPGPFEHWALYCANHIIDVASQEPPRLRWLASDEVSAMATRVTLYDRA